MHVNVDIQHDIIFIKVLSQKQFLSLWVHYVSSRTETGIRSHRPTLTENNVNVHLPKCRNYRCNPRIKTVTFQDWIKKQDWIKRLELHSIQAAI